MAHPGYAQSRPPGPELTFSGAVRVRTEFDDRTAGTSADAATLLRTRLGVLAKLDSTTSAFIQLSDSRAFGEEQNTLTDASADQFDLHQAYLEWAPVASLVLRVGRQEIAFEDERLIGTVNWANVTRAFDGLRATWERSAWTLDAFVITVEERDDVLPTGLDPRRNEGLDADRSLFGVWLSSASIGAFALADRNASGATLSDIDRYTLGGYARTSAGRWRMKGMAAAQLGRQTPARAPRQDIAAYLATAAVSYAFDNEPGVTASIQADYLSGDATPLDETHTAFNTLYATNHAFYGAMDLFLAPAQQTGFLGLFDLVLGTSVQPQSWTIGANLHYFQLSRADPTGERALGWELDLGASKRLASGLAIQAGYSIFDPSDAARTADIALGNEVLHWAFLQSAVRF